ncbi:guanine nucleotide-binding protein subunit alpha-15-like [Pseudonaja textilis]|uniref:guanine nucleotide-binding protein subunit alpha-15-like n=1 Tax=Pseudonaja textilis TaxID=8673 RepID=UPI000EA9FA59|nr:guanine nucleotide-binding protein subunit alpha-15-like [Pseudonaja textilis]XP_026579839.1 guanine nucleotide-binding protein subunit alpha-15-like [Pseudonaja textilis]XP_026579840.1 guanine nucleotide-binding protein subunit alpha-15-like [Pseudonaja textilis]
MVWCRCFMSEEEKNAMMIDKEISRLLQEQKKRDRWELKLLLLGTGEGGKSTFIKQMRIIHGVGFTEDERKDFAKVVYQNIFTSIQAIIRAMESLQIPYGQEENAQNARQLLSVDAYKVVSLDPHHARIIGGLWKDAGIRTCYKRRSKFHLLDSTSYFLSNLDRIASEGYVPSAQDILRTRVPTTGINEYCFSMQKVTLRIVDVGGQKTERRKWIHCFENVIALIYLASLSEYDQSLEENNSENRMRESLDLFRTILELPWFWNTSIILFLNKVDILEEKILTSDLAAYFPTFPGPKQDVHAAKGFILEMYSDIFHQFLDGSLCGSSPSAFRPRFLYHHYTCATDTQNICAVFTDIKDAVLASYLEEFSLV